MLTRSATRKLAGAAGTDSPNDAGKGEKVSAHKVKSVPIKVKNKTDSGCKSIGKNKTSHTVSVKINAPKCKSCVSDFPNVPFLLDFGKMFSMISNCEGCVKCGLTCLDHNVKCELASDSVHSCVSPVKYNLNKQKSEQKIHRVSPQNVHQSESGSFSRRSPEARSGNNIGEWRVEINIENKEKQSEKLKEKLSSTSSLRMKKFGSAGNKNQSDSAEPEELSYYFKNIYVNGGFKKSDFERDIVIKLNPIDIKNKPKNHSPDSICSSCETVLIEDRNLMSDKSSSIDQLLSSPVTDDIPQKRRLFRELQFLNKLLSDSSLSVNKSELLKNYKCSLRCKKSLSSIFQSPEGPCMSNELLYSKEESAQTNGNVSSERKESNEDESIRNDVERSTSDHEIPNIYTRSSQAVCLSGTNESCSEDHEKEVLKEHDSSVDRDILSMCSSINISDALLHFSSEDSQLDREAADLTVSRFLNHMERISQALSPSNVCNEIRPNEETLENEERVNSKSYGICHDATGRKNENEQCENMMRETVVYAEESSKSFTGDKDYPNKLEDSVSRLRKRKRVRAMAEEDVCDSNSRKSHSKSVNFTDLPVTDTTEVIKEENSVSDPCKIRFSMSSASESVRKEKRGNCKKKLETPGSVPKDFPIPLELHLIQLQCIKKELDRRRLESSSPKQDNMKTPKSSKKKQPSGKGESTDKKEETPKSSLSKTPTKRTLPKENAAEQETEKTDVASAAKKSKSSKKSRKDEVLNENDSNEEIKTQSAAKSTRSSLNRKHGKVREEQVNAEGLPKGEHPTSKRRLLDEYVTPKKSVDKSSHSPVKTPCSTVITRLSKKRLTSSPMEVENSPSLMTSSSCKKVFEKLKSQEDSEYEEGEVTSPRKSKKNKSPEKRKEKLENKIESDDVTTTVDMEKVKSLKNRNSGVENLVDSQGVCEVMCTSDSPKRKEIEREKVRKSVLHEENAEEGAAKLSSSMVKENNRLAEHQSQDEENGDEGVQEAMHEISSPLKKRISESFKKSAVDDSTVDNVASSEVDVNKYPGRMKCQKKILMDEEVTESSNSGKQARSPKFQKEALSKQDVTEQAKEKTKQDDLKHKGMEVASSYSPKKMKFQKIDDDECEVSTTVEDRLSPEPKEKNALETSVAESGDEQSGLEDSKEVVISPCKVKKKKSGAMGTDEHIRSNGEGDTPSPKLKKKKPKKISVTEDTEELVEQNELEGDNEEVASSKRKEKESRKLETDGNVLSDVDLERSPKKSKSYEKKIMEEEVTESNIVEEDINSPNSKKTVNVSAAEDKRVEHAGKGIHRLPANLLELLREKKPEVKRQLPSKDAGEVKKLSSKSNKKASTDGEDYIPLNIPGPTSFSVADLEKLKSSRNKHPAADLKRDLLYGPRIKRVEYSKVLSYKMKAEMRERRT